jgi:nicotinamidase-related amidase
MGKQASVQTLEIGSAHCRHAERFSASGRELRPHGSGTSQVQDRHAVPDQYHPECEPASDAFRAATRPVVCIAHVPKPDYSNAAFPYWRFGIDPSSVIEPTVSRAQIIEDLKPREDEHLVVKKGYAGFSNTPLDTVLRNLGVTTCVVSGVTTVPAYQVLSGVGSNTIIE